MSFFRVLLALLISGGIAYGLYYVVDQQKADNASQTASVAERAEIADTSNDESAATDQDNEGSDSDTGGQTEVAATENTEQAVETDTSASEGSFMERTAEAVGDKNTNAAADQDQTTSTLTALPSPPAAPETSEVETNTATTPALPAASIQNATSDSVAALEIVTGGMTYREARETLINAGWTPRALENRSEALDQIEMALIGIGYTELEGCSDAERPICRFEFVDGAKRIAAVLTAGADDDPSVIDVFLMDIAKTE